jgi:hypothetical protein
MKDNKEALEPCPFKKTNTPKLCKTRTKTGKIKYYIASGDVFTKSFTQARSAINIWNTRALIDKDAVIEMLERLRSVEADETHINDEYDDGYDDGCETVIDEAIKNVREM